ncbi:unnamed protein product [Symbiodinium sp. CCMP2456]|nr:unnamed protein product [Symbiodinium sp. CCMP2456]
MAARLLDDLGLLPWSGMLDVASGLRLRATSRIAKGMANRHLNVGAVLAHRLAYASEASEAAGNSVASFWRKLAALRKFCERGGRGHVDVATALQQRLQDPDWRVRQAVITVLPEVLESNVRAAMNVKVSELVAEKVLEDECVDVRESAASCLPSLAARGHEAVVHALKSALSDREHIVRRAAVTSLSQLSLADSSASSAVLGRVMDIDMEVRRAALISARQIYRMASEKGWFLQYAQAFLGRLRGDPHIEVRLAAVDCLEALSAEDQRVVWELVHAAGTPEQPCRVRERCLEALLQFSSEAGFQSPTRENVQGQCLGSQLVPKMAGVLHAALQRTQPPQLRISAARYLACVSHPAYRDVAELGMLDTDLSIQSLCMTAFLKIGRGGERSKRLCAAWALRNLKHTSREVRLDAVGKFKLLGRTGDEALDAEILSTLLLRLEDASDIAAVALDALAACATVGNVTAIRSSSRIFSAAADPKVKCAAARALAQVAKTGDETALSALRQGLAEKAHVEVICAAIQAIGTLSRRGDSSVLAMLVDLLPALGHDGRDDHDALREALLALARLARRGNGVVATSILRILERKPAAGIQVACVQALQAVARKCDSRVIECLLTLLRSVEPSVCEAAVIAVAELSKRGDATTICSLLPLISGATHDQPRLRIAAIRATAALATRASEGKRSDATAIAAVADCLKDAAVRSEAIEALSKMAKAGDRGDQVAIASVSRFLTHSDPDCRAAAVFSLTKVARAGDQAVVSALSRCLESDCAVVQRSAAQALGELSGQAHLRAVEELEAQLLNPDASVRDAATASLRKIRGIKAVPVIVHAWQVQRDRPVEFAKRQRSPSPPTEERFVHFRKLSSELNQECAFPIQIAQG